jgi:D-alanyl-D-alanine carboxypeptidase/D-alanyl-D-alanine-endopeptidase (penicillin-binding protein 4)
MRRSPALARLTLCALALSATAASSVQAATPEQDLGRALSRAFRGAGSRSGAYVQDISNGRVLFTRRAGSARTPASNEKVLTTGTALLRFGAAGRLRTSVLGSGSLGADGIYRGTLYLHGGGDPTFGSAAFNRDAYGTGATIDGLAQQLADAGITRVEGPVVGDESYFDLLRGDPEAGYGRSGFLEGQLSALVYERGLTSGGGAFQSKPATFAAARLIDALKRLGVRVSQGALEGGTPAGATELAGVDSPDMATLARLTNRPSDNFFAETLLKGLGARFGGAGSTAVGAEVVKAQLRRFGLSAHVIDGSGLSFSDSTSPRTLVRFLIAVRHSAVDAAFERSLSVAGRSGTLAGRMNGTAAAGRCRGKTGTLPGVSALSGYCDSRSGHTIAFSFLMNRVGVSAARSLQDSMAIAIARYRGR